MIMIRFFRHYFEKIKMRRNAFDFSWMENQKNVYLLRIKKNETYNNQLILQTMRNLLIFILTIFSLGTSAQLKVYNDGSMTLDRDTLNVGTRFTVGQTVSLPTNLIGLSSNNMGILSHIVAQANKYNYGVAGSAVSSTITTGRSFGVYGVAGNCTSGYNYGVAGTLFGTANGAAVFGSIMKPTGSLIPGKYAGYFDVDVVVSGTATITSLNTPSDIRIKENIEYVGNNEGRADIHSRMMDVHVISYNLKKSAPETDDTVTTTVEDDRPSKTFYGVSAQELRELFPDLVEEGQDGYLAVNYIELIPMLICSVQELSGEVDRLRKELDAKEDAQHDNGDTENSNLLRECALYQNTPNPSSSQTVIRYELPSTATNAYIYILNLQGTLIKQIPINPAVGSVTVSCSDIDAGMYFYSLVVSGQEVDTKKMIIGK